MCRNGKKKTLFIIDGEYKLEFLMKQANIMDPENLVVVENNGALISQYFDEIMREIIIVVYKENIEEIFVVASKKYARNTKEVVSRIYENKKMKDKIQELDYLFKTCKPEFAGNSVSEWLQNTNNIVETLKSNVNMIKTHPLLPPHVQVTELYID
ncbi:carbonic anhydrase [Rummeliibacillus sp. POC4]|uniref:carbonic anhydrase n=1 Tax=Rummeliibacillus sp. POC4 TaxID=2305899 RepID=UPI000E6646C7|nr:carbonic anhydrase [Rummeliibacillus sp. POC4]RIJ68831.1 carbonic anhydrase [Rummeliibacillus sp. POC4]